MGRGALVAVANFVAMGTNVYYGAQISETNGTHTVTGSQPVGVEVFAWLGVADQPTFALASRRAKAGGRGPRHTRS